jgi:hypothetical protein
VTVTPYECSREAEVLEALASGAAPQDWNDELRAHGGTCDICRDLIAVALPLLQEHHAAVDGAHPPSSGIVWWRAQMRARQEAARAATRPITVFQAVAAVAAVALFVMLLSATAPTLSGWFGGLSVVGDLRDLFTLPGIDLASLKPSTNTGVFLVGACAVCLLLGPLAIYFALSDE